MALALPQCFHITRKRGVYYFRRRLPHPWRGEVALSLRTRHYREAEFLSEALTNRWNQAVGEAMLDQSSNHALDREENELGVSCVAAPVFDIQGLVPYAMSISLSTARLKQIGLDSLLVPGNGQAHFGTPR
jgi:hypothetical protein